MVRKSSRIIKRMAKCGLGRKIATIKNSGITGYRVRRAVIILPGNGCSHRDREGTRCKRKIYYVYNIT